MKPKHKMKTRILRILVLLLAAGTIAHAGPQDILTVAVFNFESKDKAVRISVPKSQR